MLVVVDDDDDDDDSDGDGDGDDINGAAAAAAAAWLSWNGCRAGVLLALKHLHERNIAYRWVSVRVCGWVGEWVNGG